MNVITNEKDMVKVAMNKSLLKEYQTNDGRVVYLNDGDEFQLQLFNPFTHVVGAEIYINGERIPNKLVLRPGERVWLERYLDKAKKFKFSTYEVEDSAEAKAATKFNGEIKVVFYSEVRPKPSFTITTDPVFTYTSSTTPLNQVYYSKSFSSTPEGSNVLGSSITTSASTVSTIELSKCSYDATASFSAAASANTIETGRVDEGSHSNQEFDTVSTQFSYYPKKTEIIKILPMSRKPYYAEDVQKIYCTECGRKLQSKYKFCPFCGTEV